MITRDAEGAAYQIAEVYAWWGDKEAAFRWLDRAYAQRDGGLMISKVDLFLKKLHDDPRFPALLRKLNLPE